MHALVCGKAKVRQHCHHDARPCAAQLAKQVLHHSTGMDQFLTLLVDSQLVGPLASTGLTGTGLTCLVYLPGVLFQQVMQAVCHALHPA